MRYESLVVHYSYSRCKCNRTVLLAMFVKLRAGAAAGARMQERWRLNAASSYEDPVVRVRKRLVTAAWKLQKLAETDFPPGKLQERRQKLVARANVVGYQLTVDDTVDEIAGELGDTVAAGEAASEHACLRARTNICIGKCCTQLWTLDARSTQRVRAQ